jgi:RimJ/RimL family protein N-acetyltransferase
LDKRAVQDDSRAKKLIEANLPMHVHRPFSGLIFLDKDDRELGACIFNNYDGRNVNFTCVLLDSIGKMVVREVAYYIFHVMGCHRCTAITAIDNIKAIEGLKKIGFRLEGRMREHFAGNVDGLVFGILRSEQGLVAIED